MKNNIPIQIAIYTIQLILNFILLNFPILLLNIFPFLFIFLLFFNLKEPFILHLILVVLTLILLQYFIIQIIFSNS